jgi:6-phosphogluconolactonase
VTCSSAYDEEMGRRTTQMSKTGACLIALAGVAVSSGSVVGAQKSTVTVIAGGYGTTGVVRDQWDLGESGDGASSGVSAASSIAVGVRERFTPSIAGAAPTGQQASAAVAVQRISATKVPSPTFIIAHPKLPVFYVTSESGQKRANLRSIDASGQTSSTASSGGANPVRSSASPAGDRLAVANYDGSIALLSLDTNGRILRLLATASTSGSGPNVKRQGSSHPHAVVFLDDNHVLAADLGSDQVYTYALGTTRTLLSLQSTAQLAAGSGPRQVVVSPNGKYAYVVGELDSTITTFRIGSAGLLEQASTVKLAPAGALAEALIHPDGRWMVVLNRGPNTCVVFDVSGGDLKPVASPPAGCGKWPRHAAFDQSGKRLFVASQKSDELLAFSFDSRTGSVGRLLGSSPLKGAATVVLVRS